MDYAKFVESSPDVMMGKLVIKGTRIPVELILEKLAAGQTEEELLLDYPRLSREAIHAALAIAAEAVKDMKFYKLAS
ncbi:DUF433 domain-containing protein [Runella limosa]|uniref:DUF433 domain-containing protein n=1 Tax=Runella limosa TaxID=370978 RepID=UPI0004135C90|nr:DUF433 domain-containing protein [Runella limosa]